MLGRERALSSSGLQCVDLMEVEIGPNISKCESVVECLLRFRT